MTDYTHIERQIADLRGFYTGFGPDEYHPQICSDAADTLESLVAELKFKDEVVRAVDAYFDADGSETNEAICDALAKLEPK